MRSNVSPVSDGREFDSWKMILMAVLIQSKRASQTHTAIDYGEEKRLETLYRSS